MKALFKEFLLVCKDIPGILWSLITLESLVLNDTPMMNICIWIFVVILTIIIIPIWIISLPVIIPWATWLRVRQTEDMMWEKLKGSGTYRRSRR
jgi:hypothetical protein